MRGGAIACVLVTAACSGEVSVPGTDAGGAGSDAGGAEPDAAAIDPSDELYAQDAFPRFDLELSPESIAALEADPGTYARGDFRYGGELIEAVGVRLKGEYTFRPITGKASFKIKFDEFVDGQRFRGLARMTLNNGFEDPSLVAERMVYAAFRNAQLPAPRANNAQVYVNGELYGVYVNIETEDKTFLARWFGSNDGNLYEEQGQDWFIGNEAEFELETNETANDRSDLTALFAAVSSAADGALLADVASVLDGDRFLRYCALEALVNQWDGYAYTHFGPNNYRLYHDPTTGQFSVLPWGMDMSMKPLDGTPFVGIYTAVGYFFQRCIDSPSCRAQYDAVLAEETDRFEALALPAAAAAAYAQIRDAVYADPRIEHSGETFDAVYQQVHDFVVARPASVRAEL